MYSVVGLILSTFLDSQGSQINQTIPERKGSLVRRLKKTPSVRVNTNCRLQDIPATLFGFNIVYNKEGDEYWTNDAFSGVDHAVGAYWRYPGGEIVSSYHYDRPSGKARDSWGPNWDDSKYEPEEEWMGIDEYANNVRISNGLFMLGVNVNSGWKYDRDEDGLAEAGRLAEHVQKKDWDVGYGI